ncbi:hypothetical protein BIW11_06009 [Tropilaelaps mercedesae]|uniref:RNA polymerase II subunit B1 CTD phosphatase RPAP2 homolog n=1 Tax=Tropilaelaps mercedesae TaxID=418985 RepID=A0A1V9Y010_9ACAR|nr:hypothetical protein BIW11_06009 [Tropilaelaps mercedesae]
MNLGERQEMTGVSTATSTTPSRTELLRQKIEEKRRLEKNSLRAVEALLETDISQENFIEHCRMLWQQSYQDCTEERAIGRLCGYPLCDNLLPPENSKSPKYKICTRTNKVFALGNRRSFCSAWCYKASEWVKRQLSEVPFWMLEQPFDKSLELLEKDTPRKADNVENVNGATSAVHPSRHQARSGRPLDVNYLNSNPDCIISSPKRISVEDIDQCAQNLDEMQVGLNPAAKRLMPGYLPMPAAQEKQEKSIRLSPQAVEQLPIISAARLEALLCEWITITTLHYIVGQDRFLEIRAKFDNGKVASGLERDEYALKYERLCRFLDEQDKLEGISYSDDEDDSQRVKLTKKRVMKKVKFLQTDSKSTSAPTASASATENADQRKAADTSLKRVILGNLPDPVLPPVDKHQRNATRKRILIDRLTPIADRCAPHLQMPPLQLSRDLSQLIDTFHLTKDNCMLQPKEALVVFMVAVMLIDRRAGGEGTVPEVLRANTNAALNAVGLSWGDLRVAICKATDPNRLFR